MYHNKVLFLDSRKDDGFYPEVISVFKILTDENYFHKTDEEELEYHPSNTLSFIRCAAGSGKIHTKCGDFEISENEWICLPFHSIISYRATSRIFGYRWVNFVCKSGKIENMLELHSSVITDDEEKCFDRLLLLGNSLENASYTDFLFLDYFYKVTLSGQLRLFKNEKAGTNRQIDDICAYISQKLFTKLSVDDLAAFFDISPRRMHQIFQKELGISPKQYITKKKMEEGYRLLVQTAMPINKISEFLCFSSPYHFSNEFKKLFHQTPTQVRKTE